MIARGAHALRRTPEALRVIVTHADERLAEGHATAALVWHLSGAGTRSEDAATLGCAPALRQLLLAGNGRQSKVALVRRTEMLGADIAVEGDHDGARLTAVFARSDPAIAREVLRSASAAIGGLPRTAEDIGRHIVAHVRNMQATSEALHTAADPDRVLWDTAFAAAYGGALGRECSAPSAVGSESLALFADRALHAPSVLSVCGVRPDVVAEVLAAFANDVVAAPGAQASPLHDGRSFRVVRAADAGLLDECEKLTYTGGRTERLTDTTLADYDVLVAWGTHGMADAAEASALSALACALSSKKMSARAASYRDCGLFGMVLRRVSPAEVGSAAKTTLAAVKDASHGRVAAVAKARLCPENSMDLARNALRECFALKTVARPWDVDETAFAAAVRRLVGHKPVVVIRGPEPFRV